MATPAFNTIYTHYSDEVARLANDHDRGRHDAVARRRRRVCAGALVDDNPAKVAKINEDSSGAPATGLVSGAWMFDLCGAAADRLRRADPYDGGRRRDRRRRASRCRGTTRRVSASPAFSADFVIPPWLGTGSGPLAAEPVHAARRRGRLRRRRVSLLAAGLRESAREHPGRRSALPSRRITSSIPICGGG